MIGTGTYGKLPRMQEVRGKAERKKIKLLILPTIDLESDDVHFAIH